jgi:hypothetical protein
MAGTSPAMTAETCDDVRQLAMNNSERFDFSSGAADVPKNCVSTGGVGRTGRPEPQ